MNIKSKQLPILVASAFIFSGCDRSPPTSFSELNKVLAPTETTLEDRTIEWFADQDLIRQQVLKTCLTHLTEKAEETGGTYKVEFDNDVFSKFAEYPDCSNARKGEILDLSLVAKIYDHQIKSAEISINSVENQQKINELAADVAQKLSQHTSENYEMNEAGKQKLNAFEESTAP